MKLKMFGILVAVAAVVAVSISWPRVEAHTRITTDVTWGSDIRAIMEEHCMPCHHPGGLAPDYANFSIYGTDTQPGARAQSTAIEEYIVTNRMPPWGADERFGRFSNARGLSDEEKEYVIAWVNGGAPKGYQKDPSTPDQFVHYTWQFGQPDLVFSMPKGHVVPADQQYDSASHVFDVEIEEDTYITGFEFLVENPRNIYKMEAWLHDPKGFKPDPIEVEMQVEFDPLADEDAPEPTRMREMPSGTHYIGQWVRGDSPVLLPTDAGRLLRKGSKLSLHIDYRRPDFADPSEPIRDNSKLGLFLKQPDEIIDLLVESVSVVETDFYIKANNADQQIRTSYTVTENIHLLGIDPSLGMLATKLIVRATYPDGLIKTLLYVPKFSYRFPSSFRFADPIPAPKGTKIDIIGHYDNSEDNWDNPNDPPIDVHPGDGPTDERLAAVLNYSLDDHLYIEEVFVPKKEAPRTGSGMLGGGQGIDVGEPLEEETEEEAAPPLMEFTEGEETEASRIILAKSNFHQVEGMLARPGDFQLLVYDDQLMPIDPRNFKGSIRVNGGSEEIPLVHAQLDDIYLSAWTTPQLPLTVEATVDIAGTPETFTYVFTGEAPDESDAATARPFKAPPHEGIIHAVPGVPYRVEGTMTEAGVLRVYFYNEDMLPVDPRNFGGTVSIGKDGKQNIPLAYGAQGDDFLTARVPETLPAELYASIAFGGESKRLRFKFGELTEAPWDDWGADGAVATPAVAVGKHGGPRYYESKNGFHTVEAVMPRPGAFHVYIYDEWKNEVSPKLFGGTVEVTVGGKKQTLELDVQPGDSFLSAYFEPKFPADVNANLNITGQTETFRFSFSDVTPDPTVPQPKAAHMDHTPMHGGFFFMADNAYHHTEGAMPSPGVLRVYFYDDFKRPLNPLSFGGKAFIDGEEDPDTGEVETTEYELVHAGDTDEYLTAILPPELPTQLYVKVMLGGEEKRYDYLFEELTIEPLRVSAPPIVGGGPEGKGEEHLHQRLPMVIPNDIKGIMEMITQRQEMLEGMIAAKDWKRLFQPSWDIADLVAAMAAKNDGFSVRQKNTLIEVQADVNIGWRKLDRFGDTADAARVDAEYKKFAKSLTELRKVFGE